MTILQAIFLGFIQGVTEFLPISSSGHLILVPALFGWDAQDLVFDVVVHVATLLAVVFVFWRDLVRILRGVLSGNKEDARLGWIIVIGSLPIFFIGFLFESAIESIARGVPVVLISLVFWALVLWMADAYSQRQKGQTDIKTAIGYKKGLLIGIAQAVALIPGTSRSGITISTGLFLGLDRVTAARFSFLLSIPAILGAAVSALIRVLESNIVLAFTPMIVGFITAAVSGIFAIRFLLSIVSRVSYKWFSLYRIVLAIATLFILY